MAFSLGIDVGTNSVKAIVVNKATRDVLEEHSQPTNANLPTDVPGGDEQCATAILTTLASVMEQFSPDVLLEVSSVTVCGQMHGLVLWKHGTISIQEGAIDISSAQYSHLYTWQDNRCDKDFIGRLPSSTHGKISSGYGCATMLWLVRHQPSTVQCYNRAGTIMDLIVTCLCNGERVVMSDHNAYSWGYFDRDSCQWDKDQLRQGGFPMHLLPDVVRGPRVVGHTSSAWCGVPQGTTVNVALGDLQCSVSALQPETGDAVLNVGTSSQLCIVKPSSCNVNIGSYPSLAEVPYNSRSTLMVAAALTGANVIVKLKDFLREFLNSLDISNVSDDEIYDSIIESARSKSGTTLSVSPLLLGERHRPETRGTVANITTSNCSFGDVSAAVMRGVVENLKEMVPDVIFQELKIRRIIGSGSTLHHNTVLAQYVERVFNFPLMLRPSGDAPLGAALSACT